MNANEKGKIYKSEKYSEGGIEGILIKKESCPSKGGRHKGNGAERSFVFPCDFCDDYVNLSEDQLLEILGIDYTEITMQKITEFEKEYPQGGIANLKYWLVKEKEE